MKKDEIQMQLKTLSEQILLLSKHVEKIDEEKNDISAMQIDFNNIARIAGKYPINGHHMSKSGQYEKELYINMLISVAMIEETLSEKLAFIERIRFGIGSEKSFEESYKKTLLIDNGLVDEFIKSTDTYDKISLIIDAFILMGISQEKEKTQEYIAELCLIMGIKKDDLKIIAKLSKSIISQNESIYFDSLTNVNDYKIIDIIYPYIKEYVVGIIRVTEGCRYIESIKVNDIINFGKDSQDIQWRVLDIVDRKAFLLAERAPKGIGKREGSIYDMDGGWEKSKARKWLNSEFLNNCFNNFEKEKIISTRLVDVKTTDKIFMLNKKEIDKYLPTSQDKDFESHWGVRVEYEHYSSYWGRDIMARFIPVKGRTWDSLKDDSHDTLVRPAMWVRL